jgi:hypothetical protein
MSRCTRSPSFLVALGFCLGLGSIACGSKNDADPEPTAAALNGQSGPTELQLRVAGRYVPDWLLRLTRDGSQLTGHAMLHLEGGGTSDAEPGVVVGSVGEDGTVTLSIQAPAAPRPLPATTFTGKETGDGFIGALRWNGHDDDDVRIERLAPGTLDDHGVPLLATTRHEAAVDKSAVGGCDVDVVGGEFFALPDPRLERDLNAFMRAAIERAPSYCAPGVELVTGGAQATLLRPRIVSVATVHSVLRGEDPALAEATERHSYDLFSGKELALFGDVLAPGSESDLGYAIDEAVAAIRTDVLSSGEKKELDSQLQTALNDGRLAKRFGLTDDAIVFDAPEFVHPRITGVRVRYAALGAKFLLTSSL